MFLKHGPTCTMFGIEFAIHRQLNEISQTSAASAVVLDGLICFKASTQQGSGVNTHVHQFVGNTTSLVSENDHIFAKSVKPRFADVSEDVQEFELAYFRYSHLC